VDATDPRPLRARLLANTFARGEFIAFRAHADRSTLLKAQRRAGGELGNLSATERNGPRGQSLSQAVERLGVLASLQTGNAELVQPAGLPTTPSSRKPARNGILGGFLGLLVGISLAFLLTRLNRRITDVEEVGLQLRFPLLGYVPSTLLGHVGVGKNTAGSSSDEFEAFRILRLNSEFLEPDRSHTVLAVTSPVAEEGKSTVAVGLAAVNAIAGKRTLLIGEISGGLSLQPAWAFGNRRVLLTIWREARTPKTSCRF
jgi:hypothetical protein